VRYQVSRFCTYAASPFGGSGLEAFFDIVQQGGTAAAAYAALKDGICQDGALFDMVKSEGDDTYRVCGVTFDVMYRKNGVPGQYLETIGESPGDSAPTDLTSHEETTSPVELIVNVQVTLFWKKITLENTRSLSPFPQATAATRIPNVRRRFMIGFCTKPSPSPSPSTLRPAERISRMMTQPTRKSPMQHSPNRREAVRLTMKTGKTPCFHMKTSPLPPVAPRNPMGWSALPPV
jgi:hypothetical protein